MYSEEEKKERARESKRRYRKKNAERLAEEAKVYREANKDAISETRKEYLEKNAEVVSASKSKWHAENRGRIAANLRLRKYGLTAEQFDAMLADQGGCAICKRTEPTTKGWCVDHDHSCCAGTHCCGQCVRGILCSPCNAGIGMLGDDPVRIRAAADYLTIQPK